MRIELPYGRAPYLLALDGRRVTVIDPPTMPAPPPPLASMLEIALSAPIDAPPLRSLAAGARRITIIVSDATRAEPRAELLAALTPHLPPTAQLTVAIATGTHGPATDLAALGLPSSLEATIVNHDGHRPDDLVSIGTTARGTPVRVHRCVAETDLVIATGCIRPHYFAGFGAGVKAIFPGLGEAAAIRTTHALKTAPGSRAGIVDGTPSREDLEEAVAHVPTPTFLLNGVAGPDGNLHAVVAGNLRTAFRAGADLARTWFTVRSPTSSIVIASDVLPVTASLYQAAKICAAVAPVVGPGGVLILAAECPDGIGPLPVVNEAIFRIGVLPRLAQGVTIHLVSSLSPSKVACTLTEYAPSIDSVLARHPGPVTIFPRASQLLVEVTP